jgi:hypothetical protein
MQLWVFFFAVFQNFSQSMAGARSDAVDPPLPSRCQFDVLRPSGSVLACGLVLCTVLGVWQRGDHTRLTLAESIRTQDRHPFNRLQQAQKASRQEARPQGGHDPEEDGVSPPPPTYHHPTEKRLGPAFSDGAHHSTSAAPKLDPTPTYSVVSESTIPVTSAACNAWGCTCMGFSNRFGTFPSHWGTAHDRIIARPWWMKHKCATTPAPTPASQAPERRKRCEGVGVSRGGSPVNVCGAKVQEWNQSAASCLNLNTSGQTGATGPKPWSFCTCPWPAQWGPRWGAGPGGWVNFTVDAARELLRGKTVVLGGDSTSRRLLHTMCKFLAGNVSTSDRSGEGCCGTRRIDVYCLVPAVTREHDIMLLNAPMLVYPDILRWMSKLGGAAMVRTARLAPEPSVVGWLLPLPALNCILFWVCTAPPFIALPSVPRRPLTTPGCCSFCGWYSGVGGTAPEWERVE